MRARGRQIVSLLVGVSLLAAAAGLIIQAAGALHQTELESVDARFSIRGHLHPRADVVTVLIDDQSISQLGRFPFPRRLYVPVIDRLRAAGARTIVFDIQFTEPTDVADDQALVAAVGRRGDVVLATNGVAGTGIPLGGLAGRPGYENFPTDRDGVLRRTFCVVRGGLATLSLAAVRVTRPRTACHGNPWIDFPGPAFTVPHVSFADIARAPASFFRNKIVVIGVSAQSQQDFHPTPTTGNQLMPGAEIQADAISTALNGFPLVSSPAFVGTLLILLLAGVALLANLRLAAVPALGVELAAGGAFALACQLAFDNGVIIPLVSPLVTLAIGSVGSLTVSYVDQVYARRELRLLFGRFVPKAVVDEVLAETGPGLRLGGVRRTVTVMFSDLRGFTTFSERHEPEQVIEILNAYLSLMSEAILAHGGTLVAYMGDGIMAVFGAPLEYEDHADRAVAAAREMLARLREFNARLAAEGQPGGFRMGIGLNSGAVMAGNVGSHERLEYTALGDTTNTASRLEGMTKESGHDVFIAESTCEALREEVEDLVFVGELEVRGRQAKVKVWSFAGERTGGRPDGGRPPILREGHSDP
jgi:adenylate cyclase